MGAGGGGIRAEKATGEVGGRQMPPLWLRHCGILIGSGHIVPTLLELRPAGSK